MSKFGETIQATCNGIDHTYNSCSVHPVTLSSFIYLCFICFNILRLFFLYVINSFHQSIRQSCLKEALHSRQFHKSCHIACLAFDYNSLMSPISNLKYFFPLRYVIDSVPCESEAKDQSEAVSGLVLVEVNFVWIL